MLMDITNLLPALKQQSKYMLSALSFKMVVPIIMEEALQVLVFEVLFERVSCCAVH